MFFPLLSSLSLLSIFCTSWYLGHCFASASRGGATSCHWRKCECKDGRVTARDLQMVLADLRGCDCDGFCDTLSSLILKQVLKGEILPQRSVMFYILFIYSLYNIHFIYLYDSLCTNMHNGLQCKAKKPGESTCQTCLTRWFSNSEWVVMVCTLWFFVAERMQYLPACQMLQTLDRKSKRFRPSGGWECHVWRMNADI